MSMQVHFSFGIRTHADAFYFDELAKISGKNWNFSFMTHTSREEHVGFFP
jgi:NAD(P)H-flavin reductase